MLRCWPSLRVLFELFHLRIVRELIVVNSVAKNKLSTQFLALRMIGQRLWQWKIGIQLWCYAVVRPVAGCSQN